jgi:hypothetical protein
MTQQESLARLAFIIEQNYRHANYERCVKLYEDYLTLSTGDGVERFHERFSSRESEESFAERMRVTVDINKSVTKNLCHIYYRVTRSSGIRTEYRADEAKSNDFEDILKNYGRWGLSGYMEKRFTDFNKIDPNGLLVIDFMPTDGTDYAYPYPIEYYSPDVLDYGYILSELDYAAVKNDMMRKAGDEEKAISDYTCYTKEGAAKFIARPDIENAPPFDPNVTYVTGELVGFHQRQVKDEQGKEKTVSDVFEVYMPVPYNMEETPARFVGYLPDEATRGNTFVNFFDNAVPFLKKLIKVNSESDISACKHAFPQRLQFVRPCPNGCEMNELGTNMKDGKTCPVCQGNGFIDAHRSGLDCIFLPLTEETKDFNIDNIVKYVAVPIETIKYQDERIQQLIEMCKRVIYNTDIFSKQEISDTATGKLLEMENMYDTIYTYAVHYAEMYRWQLKMIGDITDIDIEDKISVSKDFKLLGKGQLIDMLEAASRAGASPAIIKAINDELAYSFFGNSGQYMKYIEADRLIPFTDRTKEETMLIVSQLDKKDPYRVAYLFGPEIISEIEQDDPLFYEKNEAQRREIFNSKVAEVAGRMTEETEYPAPVFNDEE